MRVGFSSGEHSLWLQTGKEPLVLDTDENGLAGPFNIELVDSEGKQVYGQEVLRLRVTPQFSDAEPNEYQMLPSLQRNYFTDVRFKEHVAVANTLCGGKIVGRSVVRLNRSEKIIQVASGHESGANMWKRPLLERTVRLRPRQFPRIRCFELLHRQLLQFDIGRGSHRHSGLDFLCIDQTCGRSDNIWVSFHSNQYGSIPTSRVKMMRAAERFPEEPQEEYFSLQAPKLTFYTAAWKSLSDGSVALGKNTRLIFSTKLLWPGQETGIAVKCQAMGHRARQSSDEISVVVPGKLEDSIGLSNRSEIHYRAASGDADVVQELLESKQELVEYDVHHCTPLHYAAWIGNEKIISLIVEFVPQLAWVNARNNWGQTSLALAAEHGHIGAVELLLAAGAEAFVVCDEGNTPLSLAARSGHVDIVRTILVHVPEQNVSSLLCHKSKNGRMPLDEAIMWYRPEVIHLILQQAAVSNVKYQICSPTIDGLSPIQWAVLHHDAELCRALVQSGKVPEGQDSSNDMSSNDTPLLHAILENDPQLLSTMMSLDSKCVGDLQEGLQRVDSPLFAAAMMGDVQTRELLFSRSNFPTRFLEGLFPARSHVSTDSISLYFFQDPREIPRIHGQEMSFELVFAWRGIDLTGKSISLDMLTTSGRHINQSRAAKFVTLSFEAKTTLGMVSSENGTVQIPFDQLPANQETVSLPEHFEAVVWPIRMTILGSQDDFGKSSFPLHLVFAATLSDLSTKQILCRAATSPKFPLAIDDPTAGRKGTDSITTGTGTDSFPLPLDNNLPFFQGHFHVPSKPASDFVEAPPAKRIRVNTTFPASATTTPYTTTTASDNPEQPPGVSPVTPTAVTTPSIGVNDDMEDSLPGSTVNPMMWAQSLENPAHAQRGLLNFTLGITVEFHRRRDLGRRTKGPCWFIQGGKAKKTFGVRVRVDTNDPSELEGLSLSLMLCDADNKRLIPVNSIPEIPIPLEGSLTQQVVAGMANFQGLRIPLLSSQVKHSRFSIAAFPSFGWVQSQFPVEDPQQVIMRNNWIAWSDSFLTDARDPTRRRTLTEGSASERWGDESSNQHNRSARSGGSADGNSCAPPFATEADTQRQIIFHYNKTNPVTAAPAPNLSLVETLRANVESYNNEQLRDNEGQISAILLRARDIAFAVSCSGGREVTVMEVPEYDQAFVNGDPVLEEEKRKDPFYLKGVSRIVWTQLEAQALTLKLERHRGRINIVARW